LFTSTTKKHYTNILQTMSEELKALQAPKARVFDPSVQSSPSSIESSPSTSRLASPAPRNQRPSIAAASGEGNQNAPLDYVYLKNVLLQFLEQKDKKHQIQLVPVLGMLLHFDKKDEQKWMNAVATK